MRDTQYSISVNTWAQADTRYIPESGRFGRWWRRRCYSLTGIEVREYCVGFHLALADRTRDHTVICSNVRLVQMREEKGTNQERILPLLRLDYLQSLRLSPEPPALAQCLVHRS